MKRVKINLTMRVRLSDEHAAIGIGSLIIFIAMIMVAGIAASVIIQTMNTLEQQALTTSQQTTRDITSGLRVTHVSGYSNGSTITQLAIFLRTTAGSDDQDLTYAYLSLSDTSKQVVLNYNTSVFSSSISGGLFGTLNDSQLTASTYGLMVIRDVDSSCSSTTPTINTDDLIVILVNTTQCFSGISTRTKVTGNIVPEYGMNGVIHFTTPSAYVDTIIELQS